MVGIASKLIMSAGQGNLPITSIYYYVISGGGYGGDGAWFSSAKATAGAGGGAGGYAEGTLAVTSGDQLTSIIGVGGKGVGFYTDATASTLKKFTTTIVSPTRGGYGIFGAQSGSLGERGQSGGGGGGGTAFGLNVTGYGGTGSAFGFKGGDCTSISSTNYQVKGGGGGGAGGAGGSVNGESGGLGGLGKVINLPSRPITVCQGGGGGGSTKGLSGPSYGGGGGGGTYWLSNTVSRGLNGKDGVIILKSPLNSPALIVLSGTSYRIEIGYGSRWYIITSGTVVVQIP